MAAGGKERASGGHHLPSQEMLDDLCSRFVLNAPEEELESFERLLFLVEQAHWFYEDYNMEQNASLKSINLREFTALMFKSCKNLRPYIAHIDDIYKDFTTYKISVPVTGGIILDESYERCLMVKGWKPGASWSFPRGKKNKDEEDHNCAVREVREETGFDISGYLRVEHHLEVVLGQQRIRLYIVVGVKEDAYFVPQTKKEISEIAWHRIDDLPVNGNETSHNRGPTGIKYYMVWPFLGPLKAWINRHRPANVPRSGYTKKGVTVYKANTSGHTTFPTLVVNHVVNQVVNVLPQQPASAASRPPASELPGKSFRNFTFDLSGIVAHIN